MFDISYFRDDPRPFYALARELAPGRYRPTIAHSFIKLLYDKGRLLKHFSQNIDCLERLAGLPGEMIVEAHGSFASQHCIDCKAEYPEKKMKDAINNGTVAYCEQCNGIVKPDIVFFGESLPEDFFLNRTLPGAADLCIVMGTSLTVQPFASLPGLCKEGVPRVLINLDRVGGMGSRPDDVLLLGDCEEGVRKFAKALGWLEDLEALWEETNPDKGSREQEAAPLRTRDERLQDEVERLTEEVDRTLGVSDSYQQRVRERLGHQTASEPETKEKPSTQSLSENQPESAGKKEKTTKPGATGGGEADEHHSELGHVFPHLARKKPSL